MCEFSWNNQFSSRHKMFNRMIQSFLSFFLHWIVRETLKDLKKCGSVKVSKLNLLCLCIHWVFNNYFELIRIKNYSRIVVHAHKINVFTKFLNFFELLWIILNLSVHDNLNSNINFEKYLKLSKAALQTLRRKGKCKLLCIFIFFIM